MKRKFLVVVMTLMMVMTMIPGVAFAADSSNVVYIGENSYINLPTAVQAIKDNSVTVPSDGIVTITIKGELNMTDIASDSNAYNFDLSTVSNVKGINFEGIDVTGNQSSLISGVETKNQDSRPYMPVISIKFAENGGKINIENLKFKNSLLIDTSNGSVVYDGCSFEQPLIGYPQAEGITFKNSEFKYTGTKENLDNGYHKHNAYPIWFKVDKAMDFVFESNTVESVRGIHIEPRKDNEPVNIKIDNNIFKINDPTGSYPEKQVVLQLANKFNGKVEFTNNNVDATSAIFFHESLSVTNRENVALRVENNTISEKTELITNESGTYNVIENLEKIGGDSIITNNVVVHSFATEWKNDATHHWHECTFNGCTEKGEYAVHTFEWIIDKEATTSNVGSKHEECTVCGYAKEAVEIPLTGTTPSTGVTTTTPKGDDAVQTGDDFNMAIPFAIAGLALAGMAVALIYRKKYN